MPPLTTLRAVNEIRRIVIGVGDVWHGARPLAWGLAEARRRGTPVLAVRVWRDSSPPGPLRGERVQLFERAASETLVEAFEIAAGGVPIDIDCNLLIREGRTADVLLGAADRDDDLLVVGAARHGPWWPFGQTVSQCAHRAGCVVLVVPRSAFARSAPARKLVRGLHRELDQMGRSTP